MYDVSLPADMVESADESSSVMMLVLSIRPSGGSWSMDDEPSCQSYGDSLRGGVPLCTTVAASVLTSLLPAGAGSNGGGTGGREGYVGCCVAGDDGALEPATDGGPRRDEVLTWGRAACDAKGTEGKPCARLSVAVVGVLGEVLAGSVLGGGGNWSWDKRSDSPVMPVA